MTDEVKRKGLEDKDIRVALYLLKKGYPKEDVIEAIREGVEDRDDGFLYAVEVAKKAEERLVATQAKEFHGIERPKLKKMTQAEIDAMFGIVTWDNEKMKYKMDFSNHDLSGLDLSGKYLDNVNFVNVNLSGTNLHGTTISFAYGENVSFEQANMKEISIYGSEFKESIMDSAVLDKAEMSGVKFICCHSVKADYSNTKMEAVHFENSILSQSTFRDADIFKSTFVNVVKDGVDVTGTRFKYSNGLCDNLVENYEPMPEMVKKVSRKGYSLQVAMKEYEHHLEMFKVATNSEVTPEIDYRIARVMREQGFSSLQVELALEEKSPCANTEENYAPEIAERTEKEVLEGKIHVQDFGVYEPVIKIERRETAQEEYLFRMEEFKAATKAEVTQEVDIKIARTMMLLGHDVNKIVASIINESPSAPARNDEARSYGRDVMRKAEKEAKEVVVREQNR